MDLKAIMSNYSIQFGNRKFDDLNLNFMNSRDTILGSSISDYRNSSDINTFLLGPLTDVINQEKTSETIVTESLVSISISEYYTKFYQKRDYALTDPPDFTFPTADLKTLVTGWLTFV